jgi:hypothetical protein
VYASLANCDKEPQQIVSGLPLLNWQCFGALLSVRDTVPVCVLCGKKGRRVVEFHIFNGVFETTGLLVFLCGSWLNFSSEFE